MNKNIHIPKIQNLYKSVNYKALNLTDSPKIATLKSLLGVSYFSKSLFLY